MWFQRIVEIDKSEAEVVLRPLERPSAVEGGTRTKTPSGPALTPADFQRVRLMRNLKLKEQKENEERVNATKWKIELLKQKKPEYERLREAKRRFEAEMRLLEMQLRREEQQLAQMQEDLGLINNTTSSHQSPDQLPSLSITDTDEEAERLQLFHTN
jgi:hypothetical protein